MARHPGFPRVYWWFPGTVLMVAGVFCNPANWLRSENHPMNGTLGLACGVLMLSGIGALLAGLLGRSSNKARVEGAAVQYLCTHCGYDLRASPARCHECGAVPKARGGGEAALPPPPPLTDFSEPPKPRLDFGARVLGNVLLILGIPWASLGLAACIAGDSPCGFVSGLAICLIGYGLRRYDGR
jgi:hypothetical protein